MTEALDPSDPSQYRWAVVLRDGTPAVIRAIRPDDMAKVVEAFHRLDPQSVYTRFFSPKKELSAEDLGRLGGADFVHAVVLVVAIGSGSDESLAGGVSYYVHPAADGAQVAEIAFTIGQGHQGRGLSGLLLQKAAEVARRHGISRFEAEVLAMNKAMLSVFQRSGLPMTETFEDGVIHVVLDLAATPAAGAGPAPVNAPAG